MANKKSLSMLSLVLWHPLKFALIAFVLFVLIGFISGILSQTVFDGIMPNTLMTTLLVVMFVIAAVIVLYKMPRIPLDQRSFVALNNAQLFIVSLAFTISTMLIFANANKIMFYLMMMETHSNISFIILMAIGAIFYLYLCGLFLSNIWAKFWRCRALGLKTWQIICTMPMAFSLLWIPGYLISDDAKTPRALNIRTNWYAKLTDWILSGSVRTAASFVVIVLISCMFFGYNAILLTLILAIIAGLWMRIVGVPAFLRDINKKYIWFVIAVNVALVIGAIILFAVYYGQTAPDVMVNISDVSGVIN